MLYWVILLLKHIFPLSLLFFFAGAHLLSSQPRQSLSFNKIRKKESSGRVKKKQKQGG